MTTNSCEEMAVDEQPGGVVCYNTPERKRRETANEALIRGWLTVKQRLLKQERQCRNKSCQARREAVLRYLEKKRRRELKNLFTEPVARKDFGECLMDLDVSGDGLIAGDYTRRSVPGIRWVGKDKAVGKGG